MIEVSFFTSEFQPFIAALDYDGYCRYIAEKLRNTGIPVIDDKDFYRVSSGRLECLDDPLTWTEKIYRWTD